MYLIFFNYSFRNSSLKNNYLKQKIEIEQNLLNNEILKELSSINSKLKNLENTKSNDQMSLTTVQTKSHDFISRFDYLSCKTSINPWNSDGNMPKYEPSLYNSPAPNSTHEHRIIRGILVYLPIQKLNVFVHEIKWLYRSWIHMQTYEPVKWRTDLIIFVDKENENFQQQDFFLTKLNCTFENKRLSNFDKPMCTLINYKALKDRNLTKPSTNNFNYNHILDNIDIFSDDKKNLEQFYSLLKSNLADYGYLDSILMAFEGHSYLKSAGYDFLIRSDMDTFLTPMFSTWLPIHCNDFIVGGGGFSSEFNRKRFRRIAKELGFSYPDAGGLGSTWISTPDQFRLVSYLTLFGMGYLANEEFTEPERKGKVGVLLWPEWHYGVLLLYGQCLALNHLIGSKQLKVVRLRDLIDFPTTNSQSVLTKLHLHVYHSDVMFSKFVFPTGAYDNMTVSENDTNANEVKFYALRMALEGKRIQPTDLYKKLEKDVIFKKN